MGSLSVLMGKQARYSVDESANFLKRLYYVEREVMRTLGGYLVSVHSWELKKVLPRHFWQDSLRADALRSRVLELRYPRRDVDQDQDPLLQKFLTMLIRCQTDAELIQGVYCVTKKWLCEAYEYYLVNTDPLDDGPTTEFMFRFPGEIHQQLKEIQAGYHTPFDKGSSWEVTLEAYVKGMGGLLGIGDGSLSIIELEAWNALTQRPDYQAPKVPHTDERFGSAAYHMPPREANNFLEDQVWRGINHINEMWAVEVPALLCWAWNDMPWDFYLDTTRWAYDECRHTMMGEERLKAWGFELGIDVPRVSDHYISQSEHGEIALLSLLHAFECGAPAHKSKLRDEFRNEGDTSSSQDFDYDWADESIHMLYGHKWMMHLFNNDLDQVEDAKEEALDRWSSWLENQHKQWDYQPYLERIEWKIKQIEAKRHA